MLRRHVFEDDERAARQLRNRAGDVGAFVQVDFLHPDAGVARRLDAGDVVHQRRELALVQRQNAVLDVLRAHSGVGPDDADDGNVDFGKDVDRHPQTGANPHDADQHQGGDDRIGPLQRELG